LCVETFCPKLDTETHKSMQRAQVKYLWGHIGYWFEFSWENYQNNPLENPEEAKTAKCNNNNNDKHKNAITEMITWPMEAKRIRDDSFFNSAGQLKMLISYSYNLCMCVWLCVWVCVCVCAWSEA